MTTRSRDEDQALIGALASGVTLEAAAREARVSPVAAANRLEGPGFRQRVEHARGELLSRTGGQLADASTRASPASSGCSRQSRRQSTWAPAAPSSSWGAASSLEALERRVPAIEAKAEAEPAYQGGSRRWGT